MTTSETCGPTDVPQDVDIDAMRAKYAQEREKRLRKDGGAQYLELDGDLADLYEVDPYTPVADRAPIDEDIEVAVLGGGFAGLLSGAYLKKAGVQDVRVIDMAGDFGGVWYWNRFPGIQCDNDAYCYIPMLEETQLFAEQEVRRRRRDLRALPGHGQTLRPLRRRDLLHPGRDHALGRGDQALAADHQPR